MRACRVSPNRTDSATGSQDCARAQDGFALVEIVVSAALLALIILGVFAGVDGAQVISGRTRSKSVAAALAQQDEERMHAMRTADLSNYQSTRTVTVAGVPYTVSSRADWVTDSSGSVSCTSSSSTADYLKTTSSVSWPALGTGRPVTVESLVAATPTALSPTQGNLSIQLGDQAGSPVLGVPVSISGPVNESAATNSAGCAFFGYLPVGTYTASYAVPGYVDPSGANAISFPASVSASATNVITKSYAQAGSINVSFVTQVGQNPVQAAPATAVSVVHPNLPGLGTRTFTAGSPQSSLTAGSLFPFTSAYGVYAGGCSAANPTTYNSNYFSNYPGLVTVAPGGSYSVSVWEPALNLAVTRDGIPLNGAHVRVTPSNCGDAYPVVTTNSQGSLSNPGYPFGAYTVCADDGTHKAVVTNVANTSVAGTPTTPVAISSTGTLGVC